MIIRLNMIDREQNPSVLFYDTEECLLIDPSGFPAIDIDSHPNKCRDLSIPEDPYWQGKELIARLSFEPEEIQKQFAEKQLDFFLNRNGLSYPRYGDKFRYFMDNFLVVPSPKHSMEWLLTTNAEFYYNLPLFTVCIFALTGKLITTMDKEVVEPA